MRLGSALAAVLFLGLSASVAGQVASSEWASQARDERFARVAQERIQAIQATFENALSHLRAVRSLFEASAAVDRNEFRAFVRSLGVDGSVQALQWIPRVPGIARRDFERAARQEGFPGFELTERTRQGNVARAGNRETYFPVYFVEPFAANDRALGFDLGSNATYRAALDSARLGGTEVAIAHVPLDRDDGKQNGILVFTPVYRSGDASGAPGTHSGALAGFGLGVFQVADLVASALAGVAATEDAIDIHVFDKSAAPRDRLLYPKSARFEDNGVLESRLRHEAMLRFAGREWLVVATPAEGSSYAHAASMPWLVLLLGMTITGLMAVCLGYVANRPNDTGRLDRHSASELARSNQERDHALNRLSKANEELDSFVHVASHDLKAPLRGVDSLVSWIVEDPDTHLSEDSNNNIKRLKIRVGRLDALLDGLLELSKAGRFDAEIETVDTRRLCEQLADFVAPPPGIAISIDPDLPTFDTVRSVLEPVFRNLISNAVKHHDRDVGHLEVTSEELRDAYRFTIRDDGPGIDPAHHDRVFKLFQRLLPGKTTYSSGIGLSVVQRLVDVAGSSIRIDSGAGQRGTAMCFTWPKTWPAEGG